MLTSWSDPTPLDFHFGSSEGRNQLRSLIRQYEIGTIKLNGQVGLLDQLPESSNIVRGNLEQYESLQYQTVCHLLAIVPRSLSKIAIS
jgi:hypothetical protein